MQRIPLTLSWLAVVATLLTAMAVTLPARASDHKTGATAEQPWLPIPQIYAKLEAAGYRNIEKIEREHGTYEVRATDQQGARVRLDVHPQTGAILERGARRQTPDGTERRQRASAECNERRCRDDLPPKTTKP
ncbi:MAG: PepSY domain-containing protein [Betaproteobacteria bacterium]|nr:PepSY domain-containing protein [Betaproteobacteria bacterium]